MIILVGGSGSNSGKTTFISILLANFTKKFSVVKVTPTEKFGNYVETDMHVLLQKGKDTARFIEYGAKKVVWVHADRANLGRFLNDAVNMLNGDIIVEGNSAMRYLQYDLSFFVLRDMQIISKQSSIFFLNNANFVIRNVSEKITPNIEGHEIYANLYLELKNTSKPMRKILNSILFKLD